MNNVLTLIQELNNQSQTIPLKEIENNIEDVKKYIASKPFAASSQEMTTRDTLHSLYGFISDIPVGWVSKFVLQYIHTLCPKITIVKNAVPISLTHAHEEEYGRLPIIDVTRHYVIFNTGIYLKLLNKNNFNVIRRVSIDETFSHYYNDPQQNKLLLYYQGNIKFLTLINLKTKEQKIIPLNHLGDDTLSHIYGWHQNICVIATKKQHYITIDTDDGVIFEMEKSCLEKIIAHCNAFIMHTKQAYIKKINDDNYYIISQDQESRTYSIILPDNDDPTHIPIIIENCNAVEYHNFNYQDGIVIAIAPQEIQISNAEKVLVILQPQFPFEFVNAQFINKKMTKLAVAIRSTLDSEYSHLMIYQVNIHQYGK